jgi:hypothetical protein
MSGKPSPAGAVGRSTKAPASGGGGAAAAGSVPKTTKSISSSATASSKASKSKKKTSKLPPAPASLPPTDEQLEADATAREEARAHLRIQQQSRLMYAAAFFLSEVGVVSLLWNCKILKFCKGTSCSRFNARTIDRVLLQRRPKLPKLSSVRLGVFLRSAFCNCAMF